MDVVRECGEAWERLITGKTNPGDVSMYVLVSVTNLCAQTNSSLAPT